MENNRENFTKIVPNEYFKPVRAIDIQKTAQIMAIQAHGGEAIVTKMANGLIETQNTAKAGDFIITNPGGEQYVIGAAKFAARYVPTVNPNTYAPAIAPLKAMRLTEDVQFQSRWGEQMYIAHGGVLVYSGPDDIYGIQGAEFKDTYSVLIMRGVKEGVSRIGVKNIAAGIGVGMSAYSLYHKLHDDHGKFQMALKNDQTANLAKTSITLDAASLTVSSAGLIMNVNQSWNAALLNGARNSSIFLAGAKYLGYAGIAIRITAGAVDFEIGRRNHDATRMRDAFADVAGGMSGGIALGIAGLKAGAIIGGTIGSVVPVLGTATGAAIGGTVLGLAGSIAGTVGGSELLKRGLGKFSDSWLKSMFSDVSAQDQRQSIITPENKGAMKLPITINDLSKQIDSQINNSIGIVFPKYYLCEPKFVPG